MSGPETVPYLDLKAMHAPIMADIGREINKVIDAHAFALGFAVEEFEKQFAKLCGVEHCVGLNSGTSAVHLALICADVQAGDEVIPPGHVGRIELQGQEVLRGRRQTTNGALRHVHRHGHPVLLRQAKQVACH